MTRMLLVALSLLLGAACGEKPQEHDRASALADATARGAGDSLDERAQTQNEANRINY